MSDEKNFRLGYSSLTGSVYAGKVRNYKSGMLLWTQKHDVTSDFLSVVVEMMSAPQNKEGLYIGTESNPKEFILKMEKVGSEEV